MKGNQGQCSFYFFSIACFGLAYSAYDDTTAFRGRTVTLLQNSMPRSRNSRGRELQRYDPVVLSPPPPLVRVPGLRGPQPSEYPQPAPIFLPPMADPPSVHNVRDVLGPHWDIAIGPTTTAAAFDVDSQPTTSILPVATTKGPKKAAGPAGAPGAAPGPAPGIATTTFTPTGAPHMEHSIEHLKESQEHIQHFWNHFNEHFGIGPASAPGPAAPGPAASPGPACGCEPSSPAPAAAASPGPAAAPGAPDPAFDHLHDHLRAAVRHLSESWEHLGHHGAGSATPPHHDIPHDDCDCGHGEADDRIHHL